MSTTQFYTDGSGGSGQGGSVNMQQVTEMNVTAPKEVTITIPETENFALPTVEVLKLIAGEQGKVLTVCEFNAEDAAQFEDNQFVVFDGTMYLKTSDTVPSVQDTTFTDGFVTVTTIDKSKYGDIVGLELV